MIAIATPDVRAAILARQFADAAGLPPGNLWEPAAVRFLLGLYREFADWDLVEQAAAAQWEPDLDSPEEVPGSACSAACGPCGRCS